MGPRIKLKGIYDQRTLDLGRDAGIGLFGVDFRPLSVNFLQNHIFREMLASWGEDKIFFHLHFGPEKDYVVESLIQAAVDVWGSKKALSCLGIELESFGQESILEKFQVPAWVHLSDFSPANFPHHDRLEGLIIDHKSLEKQYVHQQWRGLENFAKDLQKEYGVRPQIEVACNWESLSLSALQEILNPDILSVSVSGPVELNYRNVDLIRLHKYIGLFKTQWGLQTPSHVIQN